MTDIIKFDPPGPSPYEPEKAAFTPPYRGLYKTQNGLELWDGERWFPWPPPSQVLETKCPEKNPLVIE